MSSTKNRNRTMEGLKLERDDLRSTIERVKAVLAKSTHGARGGAQGSDRPAETRERKQRGSSRS
jgi:hypothetical protein